MNERENEVLRQYEIQVRGISRFRGAYLCETDEGLRILKETKASEERLQWEAWILERCRELGHVLVETCVKNREGNFLTRSADYRYYFLRTWQAGRECDRENREDMLTAAETLARLHLSFCRLMGELDDWERQWREKWERIHREEREAALLREAGRRGEEGEMTETPELPEPKADNPAPFVPEGGRPAGEMAKHNRELHRARSFIRKIRRKSELEVLLLGQFPHYLPMAEEAAAAMAQLMPAENGLIHGDYAYHHLFAGKEGVLITDFRHMRRGVYQEDLYLLLRKTLENQHWDISLAAEMIEHYDRIFSLDAQAERYLYLKFLYPERFWKQVNFYYNHRKSWIPARNLEKLKLLEAQDQEMTRFLAWMRREMGREK